MKKYIITRLLNFVPLMVAITFLSFLIIEMAPGDFVSIYQAKLAQMFAQSASFSAAEMKAQLQYMDKLRVQYALDKPVVIRYAKWMEGIITRGDFGYNLTLGRKVGDLIKDKLPWTFVLAFSDITITFVIGMFLGVYSATHQYSAADYAANGMSFFGMSVPSFMTALIVMVVVVLVFHGTVGGLFSTKWATKPWSLGKVWNLFIHLLPALFVASVHDTAGVLRVSRSQLLEVVNLPYVQTARAKGLQERWVVWKHAFRNALHPLVMSMGSSLPEMIAGETILSIVMGLPTVGLMFYEGLVHQDSYTAGAGLLISAVLLQVGNLLADIALVVVDPTITYD